VEGVFSEVLVVALIVHSTYAGSFVSSVLTCHSRRPTSSS
jgi:hypothetical protein